MQINLQLPAKCVNLCLSSTTKKHITSETHAFKVPTQLSSTSLIPLESPWSPSSPSIEIEQREDDIWSKADQFFYLP